MALNDFAVQLGDYTPTVSIKFECVNRQWTHDSNTFISM
jgi:hypothetical protein